MAKNVVFIVKDSNGDRDAIVLAIDHTDQDMMDKYTLAAKATTGVANYEADPTITGGSREDHIERVLLAAGYMIAQPLITQLVLEID